MVFIELFVFKLIFHVWILLGNTLRMVTRIVDRKLNRENPPKAAARVNNLESSLYI